MKNIVSPEWLKVNIDKENLVIIDCRFSLMDKEFGKRAYNEEHIVNAVRVDLETELSSEVKEHGGRHPLPTINALKSTFEKLGISNDSIVVVYDDGDLAGPSRLWWTMKYLGHEEVYVLDKGINAYKEIGGVTSKEKTEVIRGNFEIKLNESMRVDVNYVKDILSNNKIALVDSRENPRYRGEFEPVDKKAGHIPGALNYFWMDILDKNEDKMSLKSKEDLETHYAKLREYDEVVVYCGSGITACPNSLALSEIGIENKIYTGSFSDWVSYDNPIETCK